MARPLPLLLAALLLASCAKPQEQTLRVIAIGAPDAPFATRSPLSPPAQTLRSATSEGLVAFDAEGKIIPALAERWIIADDGLSYIFRLRDGAWRDATPLTADSARAHLLKTLAAQRGTPLGLDLAPIADVRAMAARVVEIRLTHPLPDLLLLLAQPELTLAPKATGPLALRREGALAWLTTIPPDQRGQSMPKDWPAAIRPIAYSARPAAIAQADFLAARADIVLGGRFTDYPGPQRSLKPLLDPTYGLFGLTVESESGALATPESREAIAMVIDRAALGAAIGLPDWAPTTRLITLGPDATTPERWSTLDPAARLKLARQHIPAPTAPLRLALPTGAGADALAARLTTDLARLGVPLVRVAPDAPADLRLLDAVARYPSPAWAFHHFACALRRPCSPEADALVAQAESAPPAQAATLYAQAESLLTAANLFIPLGQPLRWSLVAPNHSGFQPNRWSQHPLAPLSAPNF